MSEINFYFVGIGEGALSSSSETMEQIDSVRALTCDLANDGTPLTWDFFDDPDDTTTLFRRILRDRFNRVDRGKQVEGRPGFCVVTAMDGRAVRLEYYGGRKLLSLLDDYRAGELQEADLPNFMEEDPAKNLSCLKMLRIKAKRKVLG
jgi:hypothetical protein